MPNFVSMLPLILASPLPVEDLDALDLRVAETSNGAASRLDRRLRLIRCVEPALIAPSTDSSFELSCPSRGWRIRVPRASTNAVQAAQSPVLVKRGESVQIIIEGREFTLHYQGVAAEAGHMGDTISVKIAGSNRMHASTVSGYGKVRIID